MKFYVLLAFLTTVVAWPGYPAQTSPTDEEDIAPNAYLEKYPCRPGISRILCNILPALATKPSGSDFSEVFVPFTKTVMVLSAKIFEAVAALEGLPIEKEATATIDAITSKDSPSLEELGEIVGDNGQSSGLLDAIKSIVSSLDEQRDEPLRN